jgi:hypothetical protein
MYANVGIKGPLANIILEGILNWTFALHVRGRKIANVQFNPFAGEADIAIAAVDVSISLPPHSGYAKAAANVPLESI